MADPGASGIIYVDRSPATVPLKSATTETRTLSAPTKPGDQVLIYLRTDGGDVTLTVTGGYNEDGDTTFVFTEVGQFIKLEAIETAVGTLLWRKISDYGLGNISAADAAVLDELSGLTATSDEINATSDVSTRTVATTSTQITVTAAVHADRDLVLNSTHTTTVTLPAASGSGNRYIVSVGVSGTDGSKIIKVANTTDAIRGGSVAVNTQATILTFTATATDDTITMNNTTTGGLIGSKVEILDIAAGVFLAQVLTITTGNPATPFSATV